MLQEATTIIKQIPDDYAEATGLAKYNRSRMPKCIDRLSPAINSDGRFITGIDEESLEINLIQDSDEKTSRKKKIKALRESLEKQTGKDLTGVSKFWETYMVELKADNDLILNIANPTDVIKYNMLISNGYVAPSKDETGNPRYRDAKYYCFSTTVDNKEKVSARKIKDSARAELLKIADKKESLLLMGQFLEGPKYNKVLDVDDLYSMLSDFIELNKDGAVERFLKACKKDKQELQYKIIIDKAIRSKVIKYKDKYYQRGQVTLGRSVDEVYTNLSTPEFAAEFLSIKEEIEERS